MAFDPVAFVLAAAVKRLVGIEIPGTVQVYVSSMGRLEHITMTATPEQTQDMDRFLKSFSSFMTSNSYLNKALAPIAPDGMWLTLSEGCAIFSCDFRHIPLAACRIPGPVAQETCDVTTCLQPFASSMTPGTQVLLWDSVSAHARMTLMEQVPGIEVLVHNLLQDRKGSILPLVLHRFTDVAVLTGDWLNLAWIAL